MLGARSFAEWVAAMFQQYPWWTSGCLVLLVGTLLASAIRAWSLSRHQRSKVGFRLRSEQEQALFHPVSTVYQPKVFRGQRQRPKS